MSGDDDPWLLLVEDSEHDRELALHALRSGRVPGRLETARDGVEGLELLTGRGRWAGRDRTDLPSVIVLDLKMPMLGGLETLVELKRDPVLQTVPVVMLTSSAEDRDVSACYAGGASSYVVKPVEIEGFFEAVRAIGRYWMVLNRTPREVSDAAYGRATGA